MRQLYWQHSAFTLFTLTLPQMERIAVKFQERDQPFGPCITRSFIDLVNVSAVIMNSASKPSSLPVTVSYSMRLQTYRAPRNEDLLHLLGDQFLTKNSCRQIDWIVVSEPSSRFQKSSVAILSTSNASPRSPSVLYTMKVCMHCCLYLCKELASSALIAKPTVQSKSTRASFRESCKIPVQRAIDSCTERDPSSIGIHRSIVARRFNSVDTEL
jgi:hypothetical protein